MEGSPRNGSSLHTALGSQLSTLPGELPVCLAKRFLSFSTKGDDVEVSEIVFYLSLVALGLLVGRYFMPLTTERRSKKATEERLAASEKTRDSLEAKRCCRGCCIRSLLP
jgi:hypothetical protein